MSFKEKVVAMASKAVFSAKKNSPQILIGVGVTGAVASTVMACRATLKVNDVMDEAKSNLDKIHEVASNPDMKEKYSEKDAKKDTTIVYVQTIWKLVKLYGPAIGLGALSIGCILKSHTILKKRNAALAAAYATIDKSFKEYRSRVIEKFGEEVDKEMKYGIKAVEVKEKVTDENGKEKTVKKTVKVVDELGYSEYARFFDASSPNWEKDPELNLMFLRAQQSYFNNLLKIKHFIFLNDVYKALGIPESKAGQVVGWRYDPNNTNIDNYIDFGIYELSKTANRDFVNGYEPVILLDFNVDGVIWEKVDYEDPNKGGK